MDLTWLGHACFRLRGKTASVLTDPYPPALGPKLRALDADLVTFSHGHQNHSYRGALAGDPFLVEGPGEYEIAGVLLRGLATFHDRANGAEHGRNTVYLIELDDVRICHLGDLGHRLLDDTMDALSDIDVLLVPVGGGRTLNAQRAAEVARQVEPRVVVPMHYAQPAIAMELDPLDLFLKEMGVTEVSPLAKLTVQPSSAEAETRVAVLELKA
ncbi:MAG: MBL fold metallo-hydrolase [Candidatus Dormibacteraeota bacterium]|uniref:MBL fold metallo-hydrolase n=1 Tax=Candidatus Dormiibacter inghamiae TaxID=3127013 RepID=A0A934KKV4_9BACT|nr:MBL fold metallo-hydrolase [Candidatus Dormibacteraeota bacterium]MBJ7605854.1 MBL fold metallo-hydrolase [Candidatus Dormibacteraeota bacterium]